MKSSECLAYWAPDNIGERERFGVAYWSPDDI